MKNKKLNQIIAVGLMAALCFVGNYLQIKIPNGVLVTRIHFGNSMCLLAGLLFGGMTGGLASGIGAGLYDLLDPVYIVSAPYTFFSKFAMGFTAGKLNKHRNSEKSSVASTIIAAIAGQIVYIILYSLKTFITLIILGNDMKTAWAGTATNLLTSSVNAVIAVVVSVPLYFALRKALKGTGFYQMITEKSESKGYFNPVTVALTAFAVVVTAIFTINLAATTKIEAQEEEERAELQAQLDEANRKIDILAEKLGVTFEENTQDGE